MRSNVDLTTFPRSTEASEDYRITNAACFGLNLLMEIGLGRLDSR